MRKPSTKHTKDIGHRTFSILSPNSPDMVRTGIPPTSATSTALFCFIRDSGTIWHRFQCWESRSNNHISCILNRKISYRGVETKERWDGFGGSVPQPPQGLGCAAITPIWRHCTRDFLKKKSKNGNMKKSQKLGNPKRRLLSLARLE